MVWACFWMKDRQPGVSVGAGSEDRGRLRGICLVVWLSLRAVYGIIAIIIRPDIVIHDI